MLILNLFMNGCSSFHQTINNDKFIIDSIPNFPYPHKDTIKELSLSCNGFKCLKMYEWLGKLMIFEKQLNVIRESKIK